MLPHKTTLKIKSGFMVEKMVRIIYANDGISTYDKLFLSSLKRDHEVYLLTFHNAPSQVPPCVKVVKMPELIGPITLHPFEGIRKHGLTPLRILTFRSYVSKIKPDVVIGCWASTYGFYAASSGFHPYILFVWGSDIMVYPVKYKPLRFFISYALKKADAILADSDAHKKATISLGGSENKIIKFPWVKLDTFEPDEKTKIAIRKNLGWSRNDIVVISLRDHKPIYDVDSLIEAIPQIVKKVHNAKFLILGEGPLTLKFKKRINALGLASKVTFIGRVPHQDVAKYLNAADIYVSTSLSDGSSACLLEAMACSLPPVVTNIEGNREWIKDGINGCLVPTCQPQELAEKIIYLAKNRHVRDELANKAIQTIKTRINWEKNTATLNETIMMLVSGKNR